MGMTDSNIPRRQGFTLIELLVVISIIGVLAALGFSGASAAIKKSQMTECLSNMRQIGTAMQLFVGENGGRLPGTSHGVSWTNSNSLGAYLGTNFIGRCPAFPKEIPTRVTYGWNDSLAPKGTGILMASSRTPASTMALAELATNRSSEHFHFAGVRGGAARVTPNQFRAAVNVEAHGKSANYLFVDGHAENLAWTEVQSRLAQTNSTFLVP
jgi:prepilin-type N-terminal cleavage/methylation domain-containing protein/prepilin-type processing-associated H-X9-DG protein